jgi:chromosome segregation ATPase
MKTDNPLAEQIRSLTEQIRDWYERSPKAQRAYEQLSTDVDAVAARVAALVEETEVLKELRDKIAASIDSPTATGAQDATASADQGSTSDTPSETTSRATEDATSRSGAPPDTGPGV